MKGQEINAKNELGKKKTHTLGGNVGLARLSQCHIEEENQELKDNIKMG